MWTGAFLFTLMRGKWAPAAEWQLLEIDFLTLITAALYAVRGAVPAGLFALVQGLFMDVYAGSLRGFFGFVQLSTFVAIYLLARFFNLQNLRGQVAVVGLAVLLKRILLFWSLRVPSLGHGWVQVFAGLSLVSAVVTALAAPLLFMLGSRMFPEMSGHSDEVEPG